MRKTIRALPIFSIAAILAVPSITAQQLSNAPTPGAWDVFFVWQNR